MFEKFFGFKKTHEQKDTLRSKHLKEGVNPIVACIGTPRQFLFAGGDGEALRREPMWPHSDSAHNVNYSEEPDVLTEQGMKNAGSLSYVISPIDALDKISGRFLNCTGLVVAGKDKKTGENISFLTHQDPHYFLTTEDQRSSFVNDLEQRLKEIEERCETGTIDAVIVGGNSDTRGHYKESYINSIKLLSEETQSVLGFEPVVMTGPKSIPAGGGMDNVFYDNANKRLYIERPIVGDESTESFRHSAIEKQKKKW